MSVKLPHPSVRVHNPENRTAVVQDISYEFCENIPSRFSFHLGRIFLGRFQSRCESFTQNKSLAPGGVRTQDRPVRSLVTIGY